MCILGLLSYTFQLPPSLPNGSYLLRIEHIGVHNAANANSAQFFVNCAQVHVTGGGSGNPGPLVSIPGLYSAEDPGIHFNNYYPPVRFSPPPFPSHPSPLKPLHPGLESYCRAMLIILCFCPAAQVLHHSRATSVVRVGSPYITV
jgi:hypothetical protein